MRTSETNAQAWHLPRGERRRLLTLGLPAILAATICVGAFQPLRTWYDTRKLGLELKEREVSHLAGLQKLIPGMRAQLAALRSDPSDRRLLLAGGSDALANAALQKTVAAAIARSNANLTSTTILPATQMSGLRQIAIAVDLTTQWPALISLLNTIDLDRPRMIVSGLSIADAGPAGDVRENIPLQVSFTVTGFRSD